MLIINTRSRTALGNREALEAVEADEARKAREALGAVMTMPMKVRSRINIVGLHGRTIRGIVTRTSATPTVAWMQRFCRLKGNPIFAVFEPNLFNLAQTRNANKTV